MKFGLLLRPQDPPAAENIGRRWQETLDAAQAAEEAGFDGVFVPEHHMMPDGYLPAPLVACGALAARTRRVDVGTTVFLLPYYKRSTRTAGTTAATSARTAGSATWGG